MPKYIFFIFACLIAPSAQATVRVFVRDTNGVAWITYQCTAGEVVRAFALNVSVDQGQIFGISDYFIGISQPGLKGYGIFPASFRDHATVTAATNVTYDLTQYNPLAVVADNPANTLPGLNTSGVTLELAALWEMSVAGAAPGSSGTLCALHLTRAANVAIAPNVSRGGVVLSPSDIPAQVQFIGAFVDADAVITSQTISNGFVKLTFKGGELESAPVVTGPWTGTGNSSGFYTEPIGTNRTKFYRVHHR